MKARMMSILLLGAGLAGCEQESQTLPFSAETGQMVSKSIPASGGRVSTPAGASVHFPDSALSASATVTLTVATPPAALQQSGEPISGAAFELTPAGLQLNKPASVELQLDPSADSEQAWLASVVSLTPNGAEELGETRVDLAAGVVHSEISRLGTLAVVIPEPDAIFPVETAPSAAKIPAPSAAAASLLGASGTDSVRVGCGSRDNRCAGLRVEASHSLLERVHRAAAVYPQVRGTLRIDGGSASGVLSLRTPFRVKLQSGRTAENVVLDARVEPTAATTVSETASELVFTHMSFRVSGGARDGSDVQETVGSLVISKSDSAGWITIERHFQIPGNDGTSNEAYVSVTVPVQLFQ
jgi:hypothetical protein